jgi:predicted ATPase
MARNTGRGSRIGSVKNRTQVQNPKTGRYVERDTTTGQFVGTGRYVEHDATTGQFIGQGTIKLENFKNFASAEIDLSEPLTVVIGTNGSGKSNLIEAIELFGFIANGGLLHEITDIGQSGKQEVRGGLQACTHYQQDSFQLVFSGAIDFEDESIDFGYSISIITSLDYPFIAGEHLDFDDILIFKRTSDIVTHNEFSQEETYSPQAFVAHGRSALSQYKEFAIENKQLSYYSSRVDIVKNYLKASFVFDPNPKLMRDYERIGNQILAKNGANISAVLYGLSKGTDEDKQSLQRLLNWIQQLPDEPFENFEFVVVKELNDVIFGFRSHEMNELISAKVLSDGTLRCLAVLTALETVKEGSRIIIEEFDNGLHPSRVKILVQAMEDCCARRKLNVLVTTHNPATLNALSVKQLDGVVLCHWDKQAHASNLLRLSDLPYHDELLSRGQLGDLVTRQIIDTYLAPNFEQERKEKALAWLANF